MKLGLMNKTLEVEGNIIIFEFNSPNIDEGDICENFNYNKKPFVCTIGIYELIDIKFLEDISSYFIYETTKEEFIKRLIGEIIDIIYKQAKNKRLDYLQKLSINNTNCWIIDNGVDICLMLPSEY